MNNFHDLNATEALAAGQAVTSVVKVAPNDYGFDAGLLSSYHQTITDLAAAISAAHNAELAARAAIRAKNDAKASMVYLLSYAAKQADANGNVTDQMLIAIGFSPRAKGGTKPTSLNAPTDLKILGTQQGGLKASWSRNGSKQGVMFVVESSADGVEWEYATTTTKASYAADGHAPGDPIWLRVTATTSTLRSAPSSPVSLYAPAAPSAVTLKLAA